MHATMQASSIVEHIVEWLTTYGAKADSKGFVVGVSGGIDSAVTSTLVAKTNQPTLCLEMPIHQAPSQAARAQNHINALQAAYPNVASHSIDLTPVFDGFVSAMPGVDDESTRQMSLANTRARLRMTTLYYFSALHGYLVAGTGNKVEDFGVGFFSKYGDGGVDLSPIADLHKTEVYALGEELGVNEEIMLASPTDGLFGDNRSDEDQLGASYKELEWAMAFNQDNSDKLTSREIEVLEIYQKLRNTNQHKMQPIPVCAIPQAMRMD